MPKVPVALNGWSQQPDERGGAPRVARITNCLVDNIGKLLQSPGQAAIPTDGAPYYVATSAAVGDGYQLCQADSSTSGPGLRIAREHNGSWLFGDKAFDWVSMVEAPRLRKLFAQDGSHYSHPGVLEAGNGDLVVFAERKDSWSGATDGSFSAAASVIEWALLSAVDALAVVKRGVLTVATGATDFAYPVSAGPYLVWRESAYSRCAKWNTTTRTFDVRATSSGLAVAPYLQIDASYWPATDRLLIIGRDGSVYWVNAATGAQITNAAGATLWGGALACEGTCSCLLVSDYPGYAGSPVAYITAQTSSTVWKYQVLTCSDGGFGIPLGPTVLHTSPQPLSNVNAGIGILYNQRVGLVADTESNSVWAVVPSKQTATANDDTPFDTVLVGCGASGVFWTSGTLRRTMSASRPAWTIATGPVWWGYDSLGSRTLRGSQLFAQGALGGAQPLAYTALLVGGDPGVVPTRYHWNGMGALVRSNYLPPLRTGRYRPGWVAALAVQKSTTNEACDVWISLTVDGRYLTDNAAANLPEILQPAGAGKSVVHASGMPATVIQGELDLGGFLFPPRAPMLAYAGGGSYTWSGTETVRIVAVVRYIDRSGATVNSPVSEIATMTPAAGVGTVTLKWSAENSDPFNTSGRVYFYREVSGVYYEINGPRGADISGVVSDTLVPLSYYPGGAIPGNILYTQGTNGALAGAREHFGCPPCRAVWSGRNRMIAGGLADEYAFQFSNLYFPTQATSWPQDAAFKGRVDEPVTAVAALGDWFFVFSDRSIWIITGPGPDATGSGAFDDPLRVSTGIGCRSQRSLVETPKGLFFQALDGQIYLLAQGSTTPVLASQGIRDNVASALRYDPGSPERWVEAAAYDPETQEVWFAVETGEWVLQLEFGAWRFEKCTLTALGYPIGASCARLPSHGYFGPVICRFGTTSRIRRRSEASTYLDPADAGREVAIETNDIDLGPHGRLRRGWMTLALDFDEAITSTPNFYIDAWWDGLNRSSGPDESRTLAGTTTADRASFIPVEFDLKRQKGNAVRLKFSAWGQPLVAFSMLEFALELETTKGRPIKYTAGSGRMP